MKTLKKFSTFQDMKADEAVPADRVTRMKKHAAFEQLMMEMMAVHRGQSVRTMKTKESKPKKTFDAVKFMRDQRNRISKDLMDLSPEEVVAYFKKHTKD